MILIILPYTDSVSFILMYSLSMLAIFTLLIVASYRSFFDAGLVFTLQVFIPCKKGEELSQRAG